MPAKNAYRYIKDEREFCYFESVNTFCADSGDLVLMDGTPALNLASFVTTYM